MILLDTSIFIGLAFGDPFRPEARMAMIAAGNTGRLWVSAVSAWELGILATRTGRTGPRLGDARGFFQTMVARSRLGVLPLSSEAALESAYLPDPFHRDPADRMLVATARVADLTIVTSDGPILDYAAFGHVKAIRA